MIADLALARQHTRLVRLLLYRYLQLDLAIIQRSPMPEDRATYEQLIQRVTRSFGPASDGGQLATNTALAQRILAALIELKLITPSAEETGKRKDDGTAEGTGEGTT